MLSKKLSDIDETLLQRICEDRWPESETLEFKQILPKAGDNATKQEFVKDVSAFANSGGGDLVYGISEKDGAAHTPIPLMEPFDGVTRRLEQVLEAGAEPRIRGIQFHPAAFASGGYVLVMRIPASFNGPHRCIGERRFVMRANSRTSDMSYDQLRNAFDRTATLVDRARQFRADRIAELAGRSTWKSRTLGPICALHIVPLSGFSGGKTVDLTSLQAGNKFIGLSAWRTGGWSTTYNLDGLAAHTPVLPGIELAGVNQFYRNGSMEAVYALGERANDDKRLPSTSLTEFYREAADRFLQLSRELGVSGPAIIGATLLHVENYEFAIGHSYSALSRMLSDREHLVLPETWIEDTSLELSVDEIMQPILDVLWQSFGADSCLLYDGGGKWSPGRTY